MMTTGKLLWNTTWRGTVYGFIVAAVGLTGLVALSGGYYSNFFLMGGLLGAPLGMIGGFLLGIVMRLFFFPLRKPSRYRLGVAAVSASYSGLAWLILYDVIGGWVLSLREDFVLTMLNPKDSLFLFSLVYAWFPALLYALLGFFSSRLIANWYENETRGVIASVK